MDTIINLPRALIISVFLCFSSYAQVEPPRILTNQELRFENIMMRNLVIPLVGIYYKEHGRLPQNLGDLRDSMDLTRGLDENSHLGPVGERYAILPEPVPYLDGDKLIVIALRPVLLEKKPGVYESVRLAGYYSEQREVTGRTFIPESEVEKFLAPLKGLELRPMGPALPPTRRLKESRDFSYMERRLMEDPPQPAIPLAQSETAPIAVEPDSLVSAQAEPAPPASHRNLIIALFLTSGLIAGAIAWVRRGGR